MSLFSLKDGEDQLGVLMAPNLVKLSGDKLKNGNDNQ